MTVDPWQIATGCIALLASLLAYLGNHYARRIDNHAKLLVDHGDRITRMETSAISKTDLREMEQRLQQAFSQTMEMHVAYLKSDIAGVREDAKEAKEAAREKRA